MKVFIMRHGDAVPDAASDALRPLSERGVDESQQMARWLDARKPEIDRVLVSPYVRAQQTLAELRGALPLPDETECLPQLTPGGDADVVGDYLRALAGTGVNAVLVVSHLPLVGYLVAALCPQESAPMFATSGIARVTVDAASGTGVLDGYVSPSRLTLKQ